MQTKDMIQNMVSGAFPGARVEVRDLTGGGDHFELFIVTPEFEGKGLVDRHRMIYSLLGDKVGKEIHALALKTLTPLEAKGT